MHPNNTSRVPAIAVGIRGFGRYLPARSLTNDDLVERGCPVTTDWIVQKTGIRRRHFADPDQAMSDLAIPAARAALSSSSIASDAVDSVIVAGDMHDAGGVQLTSALVANALGMDGVQVLDIRAGCPASVLALHHGTSLVASGLADRALVIAAEINTRDIDYTDRTSVWFGDGAAAVILERCHSGTGVLTSYTAGRGRGSDILIIPAGGSREPITPEALAGGRHRLQMDAHEVFKFAVERMVESLRIVMGRLGLSPSDLDWIVPHQANLRIVDAAMDAMKLPRTRAFTNIASIGNTAGPSALLALAEGIGGGTIRAGQLVGIVGFGGGLAWGAQVIRVNRASDFASTGRIP